MYLLFDLDGANVEKRDLLAAILARGTRDAADLLMIGDREHDMLGATANGVSGIGVLWGFGDAAELNAAGAKALAHSPGELVRQIDGAGRPA